MDFTSSKASQCKRTLYLQAAERLLTISKVASMPQIACPRYPSLYSIISAPHFQHERDSPSKKHASRESRGSADV